MPGFPSIERGPKLDSISWMTCEAPCDVCPLRARCRAEKLACEQFNMFFRRGGTAWRHLPRDPTTRIYRSVFRSGGKAVKPRKTARRARKIVVSERAAQLNGLILS
jgi:hypothetical protein